MDEYIWASAVGRIRMMQQTLLNDIDIAQVTDAKSLEAALASLRDTGYGRYFSELHNPFEFDKALEEYLKDAYDSLEDLSPEPLVLALYRAKHDFHNLKVFAKERYLDMEPSDTAFSVAGNFTPETLNGIVDSWLKPPLPPKEGEEIPVFIKDKENLWGETENIKGYFLDLSSVSKDEQSAPFFLDASLDQAYYEWSNKILRRYRYPELLELRKSEIDLLNLRMAVRARRQGVPGEAFSRIALKGGNLSYDGLLKSYNATFDEVVRLYKDGPWYYLAQEASAILESKESLTLWERRCDNAFMDGIRKIKSAALGPMAVVGYLLGKETEVRNLRIVLSGKQSEISPQGIRERLREAYV